MNQSNAGAVASNEELGAPIRARRLSDAEYKALMETERAAFEEWAGDYGRIFRARQGDGYEFPYTQEAWVGWMARAARHKATGGAQ